MYVKHKPHFRIWVEGTPRSQQSKGPSTKYIEKIRSAVSKQIKRPSKSQRIGIEIWFEADTGIRSDVDNIIKLILDSLSGIVYEDDRQVRWVKAVAIPTDDHCKITGWFKDNDHQMLETHFLINIFEGTILGGTAQA